MRPRELRIKRARGFLLVVAILLLVVVAIAVAALGNMTSADVRASSGHAQSEQAYFAAKSGVEYASFQLGPGTPCSSGSINNFSAGVGQGRFRTTSQTYLTWTATTNNPLAANATTVSVATTAAFAPHGRIWIDAEQMNYSGKTATAFTGVSRGLAGSTATAHALGSMVSQDQCLVKSTGTSGGATRVVEAAIARSTNKERAMMVYAKGTALTGGASDRRIYYRMWDPVNKVWLGEQQSAEQVNGSPIMFVLRFARTRNEAILGILDGSGRLYIHVWNGTTNSWSNPRGSGNPLMIGLSTATRGFQIAYEHTNDRAIIVYANGAAANPKYAIWDGTSLDTTPAAGGFIHSSLGLGSYVTSNVIRWFRLATNRQNGSNSILMVTFDSGNEVWGARWDGTNWVKMEAGAPARWDNRAGSNNDQGAIDVAYESVSGKGLFGWGDNVNNQIRWITWDPVTLTLSGINTTLIGNTAPCATRVFEWFRLYSRPDSDEIMGVFQNTSRDLMSVRWDGFAWDNANRTCHGANTETRGERDFDFAWQTLPAGRGRGWVVWGSRTAAGGRYLATRSFSSPAVPGPGGAWGGVTKILDRTMMVKMGVLPLTGTMLAGLYQATGSAADDEQAIYADGGAAPPAWTAAAQTIWTGPTSLQQGERVYIETSPTGSIILQQQEIYP
jgi:Tfp pilus assembly protein PilX